MAKEAKARLKINRLLEEAGWRFFDDENGYANIQVEPNVKMTKVQVDAFGENFDKTKNGFIDFLLLDENGNPYVVLEAKSEDKQPLVGKEQAREYAKSLFVRYVILSNGNQHYFWNIYKGDPQIITSFPSCESLKMSKAMNAEPAKLYNEEITKDYIAVVKDSHYMDAPEYKNPDIRKQFIFERGLRFLRGYQVKALQALQQSVKDGKERFLFEMATGTGKTLTSAAVIRLFLRSGNANRVLFLVDRIELENQAKKNFVNYLSPDYHTVIFKENTDDWRKAEIVVSTVQTLMFDNKYKRYFKPTDFSLIIADESHRSINGNSRAVFEYFLGYKLGLTATPKDYIKNIDVSKLKVTDPRAWEKRQLLDSYRTFGCESGDPTYRYSLLDGVNDPEGPFLVNPKVYDARTDITTKLLAEEGYAILNQVDEQVEDAEETYFARDFEKKFFSEETNKLFVKTFMDYAKRDPISGEIGKGIIFCVSRLHAAKITQLLNLYATLMFPDKYQSDFAMQITSDVMNAQSYTINFQNNNLSGYSSFLDGYKSSKTRICVTVGMMTTGYDCEDLLNIGLFRPIFSPTDFIQIKGRGTRMNDFILKVRENGVDTIRKVAKDNFYLFDFFGNYEYFEDKFDYDVELKLPKPQSKTADLSTPQVETDRYENFAPDPLKSLTETQISSRGMKIDRMYFDKFEETVKEDPVAKEQYEQGNYQAVIKYIDEYIMDKPNEYYSWDKLRRATGTDRRVTTREIIDKVFGALTFFKSKHQLVEDEFESFTLTKTIPNEKFWDIKHFFEAYLTDKEVRRAIEDRRFTAFGTEIATYTLSELRELGMDNMLCVINYINDNVNVSRFM
ncbi:DEAD/DEAH box helicase family protein [Anaerorhabdus furcosa]|uniref:Type I restriction enzyme, R subunit n=1 Tax=Anaerorhabdus furcosa TaxID=118967 RepID=A0A1T4PXZ8_9FIRM|nr:DEAD/DEAH box helicase family protein [Anaerorhabdus furcosa]SJZ96197.1 type I restriction enzyme, R subunit [Anaerorhabdus furcosa]